MARFTGRFDVPAELPVAALVATAALPLSRLFRPGGFTGVVLSTVVLSVAISWTVRRFRIPAVLGLLLSLAGLLWYLAARFYPHTLFGVFPTPSSIHGIVAGVHDGIRQTIDDAVPVIASGPLLMFVAAGVWVSAWLADAAAVWVGNPLLAIAATVPLFATPSTLIPSQRRWLDTGLYIAAAAWVLFAEERARAKRWRTSEVKLGWRPGPAVRVAAVGVLIVVAMTPFIPGYGAPPLLRTSGPGSRTAFNPFIAIRATLQKRPDVPLFTLSTNQPTYLRLTTLEHFDGDLWRQGNVRNSTPIGPATIPPYDPSVQSELVQQHYRIQDLAGPWLPASYDPTSVTGVSNVKIETETRSLVLPQTGGLPSGATYDVTSQVPVLTVADLDKPFSYDEQALSDYLSVGGSVPSVVRQIAQRVAGDQTTPFRKAVALQDYLRTFTYDENVALHHSFKDVVEFLTKTKRGYCEQFAGTMALMARTIGLPSRVAIGFGFGARVGDDYLITTREAHAWVEIYFPGAGWVAFEPTPRAGVAQVPSYAAPGVANPSASPGVAQSASPSASPSPSRSTREIAPNETGSAAGAQRHPAWMLLVIVVGGVLALVAFALAVPPTLRLMRRRRAQGERGKGVFEYLEFLAWCSGAGLGRKPGETPLEHAGRLSAANTDAVRPLNRLAELADDALWGPEKSLDAVEMARLSGEARSVLRSTVSRRARWLAAAGWGRWRLAS